MSTHPLCAAPLGRPHRQHAIPGTGATCPGHEASRRPHRCDERCVCPLDGKPLLYGLSTDEHACSDPDCANAHGIQEPSMLHPTARPGPPCYACGNTGTARLLVCCTTLGCGGVTLHACPDHRDPAEVRCRCDALGDVVRTLEVVR